MRIFHEAHCLICHDLISPIMCWRSIFSEENEAFICPICEGKLEKIEGEHCEMCSRPFKFLDEKFRKGDICYDCERWEEDPEWQGYLNKNYSIFLYNDFFKEVMTKYKFRGDYVLAKIFADRIKEFQKKLQPDILVPIPLSKERLYERGFNQASALIIEAGLSPTALLTRIHSEKQSKKSRKERIHISQVFQVDVQVDIKAKSILLIDDIYTTGSTLRHAAKLLKDLGAERIQSLTLAR